MTVLADQLSRCLKQPGTYFQLTRVHRAMDGQSGSAHAGILVG